MPYHTRGSIHVIHTHTLPTSRKSCTNTAAASARRAHERRPFRTASLSAELSRATARADAHWTCSLPLAPPKIAGPALDGTASSTAPGKLPPRRPQARGRDVPARALVSRRVHWHSVSHRRARQDAVAEGDSQCARAPGPTRRARGRLGGHMPAKEAHDAVAYARAA